MESPVLWFAKSLFTTLALVNHILLPFDHWVYDAWEGAVDHSDALQEAIAFSVLVISFLVLSVLPDLTKQRYESLYKLCIVYVLVPVVMSESLALTRWTKITVIGILSGMINSIVLQCGVNLSLEETEHHSITDMLTLFAALALKLPIHSGLKHQGIQHDGFWTAKYLAKLEQYLHWIISVEIMCLVAKFSICPPVFLNVCRRHGVRITRSTARIDMGHVALQRRDETEAGCCAWYSLMLTLTAVRFVVQSAALPEGPVAIAIWTISAFALSCLGLMSELDIRKSLLLGITIIYSALIYQQWEDWIGFPQLHPIVVFTALSIFSGAYLTAEEYFELPRTPLYPLIGAGAGLLLCNLYNSDAFQDHLLEQRRTSSNLEKLSWILRDQREIQI